MRAVSKKLFISVVLPVSLALMAVPQSLAEDTNQSGIVSKNGDGLTVAEKNVQSMNRFMDLLLVGNDGVGDFFLSFSKLPINPTPIGNGFGRFEPRSSNFDCADRSRMWLDGETRLHSGLIEQDAKDPFERDILVGTVVWTSVCETTWRGIALRIHGAITIPSAVTADTLLEFEGRQHTITFGRLEIRQIKILKSGYLIPNAPRFRMTNSGFGEKLSEHFIYDRAAGTLQIESSNSPMSPVKDPLPLDSHWLDFDVQRGSKKYVLTVELPTIKTKN